MLTVLTLSLFRVSFRSFHQCPKQSWWHWVGITIASRTSECFTYSCFFFFLQVPVLIKTAGFMLCEELDLQISLDYLNTIYLSSHADVNIEGAVLSWSLWPDRSAGKEIDCCSVTSQLPQMSKPSRLGGARDSSWTRGSEQQRCICFGSKVCKALSASSVAVSFLSGLLRPWVELTDSKIPRYS